MILFYSLLNNILNIFYYHLYIIINSSFHFNYKDNKIDMSTTTTSTTVTFTQLSDRYVGMAIAVVITGLIAGALLQYTRRFRNMPSYFRSTFSFFRGTVFNFTFR